MLRQGTIADATIIEAPNSTKNRSGTRDPQMHQTKKGNQWFFGRKAHIGVDRESERVHTVVTTAANVADVTQTVAGTRSQGAWRADIGTFPMGIAPGTRSDFGQRTRRDPRAGTIGGSSLRLD